MAQPTKTRIRGVVRDMTGDLYEGAVIEVYVNSQFINSDALIGNEIGKIYSDTYGRFTIDLVPSSLDAERENYYTFKIIKDTVNVYKKIVPESAKALDFEDLPNFLSLGERTPLLGNLNNNINTTPITLPQEFTGFFTFQQYEGDGQERVFTAPGEIYIVVLNGVVMSGDATDYTKINSRTVEFNIAPQVGDLIAIQYRI